MIKFECSQCGESLEAPDSLQGDLLQCPECRFPEKVPVLEKEPDPIRVDGLMGDEPEAPTQISTFESTSELASSKYEFKRSLVQSGSGATRVRTFHTRLSDNAMAFLDSMINEWVDQDPDIEVKFSTITVGMVEGKKTEPHMIVMVWY